MSSPTSDVLVIGGGVAGLTLALEVADHLSVTLVRPALDDQGASRWAQGGIAAVLSPDDDLDAHVRDTLIAGDGLCDEEAVRFTVTHGPDAIQWLIDNGVPFTPDPDPSARYPYHLTREGGHNARRIIHADDATGRAVVDTLYEKVTSHPNITQRSDLTILHLISEYHRPLYWRGRRRSTAASTNTACQSHRTSNRRCKWPLSTHHHSITKQWGRHGDGC